jgi:hypothetical protein
VDWKGFGRKGHGQIKVLSQSLPGGLRGVKKTLDMTVDIAGEIQTCISSPIHYSVNHYFTASFTTMQSELITHKHTNLNKKSKAFGEYRTMKNCTDCIKTSTL